MEKDTVTRKVQILDILPGDPPQILTAQRLIRHGKPGRLFQQMIPVQETALFDQFIAQVCKGDTIEITVTMEWQENSHKTYLSGFALLPKILSGTLVSEQ